MIYLPTPIQDETGFLIQLRHKELTFDENLDVIHKVELVYYTNRDGKYGKPILDVLAKKESLSDQQKSRLMRLYRTEEREISTVNQFLDKVTKERVDLDDNGNPPENSVPESTVWLKALRNSFEGETLEEAMSNLIIKSMKRMVTLKEI